MVERPGIRRLAPIVSALLLAGCASPVPTPTPSVFAMPSSPATPVVTASTLPGASTSPAMPPDTAPSVSTAKPVTGEVMAPAPISGRWLPSSAWIGSELLVTGGSTRVDRRPARDGAAYDPKTNTWRSIADQPNLGGGGATALWTGDAMLLWSLGSGGDLPQTTSGGASYSVMSNQWKLVGRLNGPPDGNYLAVWTGTRMLIWGNTESLATTDGALYDPAVGGWRTMPSAPIGPRWGYSLTWTGAEAIVFGGVDTASGDAMADGAAFNPNTDMWRRLPAAPITPRRGHIAAWTGRELVVFGGLSAQGGVPVNDGAAYDPSSGRWRVLPASPLGPRLPGTAVWTGSELVLWGGTACAPVGDQLSCSVFAADGASLDPQQLTWRVIAPGPLGPRTGQVSAWTGSDLIIWGGQVQQPDGLTGLSDGAIYEPSTDTWLTLSVLSR